jgi:hypothetical protein
MVSATNAIQIGLATFRVRYTFPEAISATLGVNVGFTECIFEKVPVANVTPLTSR